MDKTMRHYMIPLEDVDGYGAEAVRSQALRAIVERLEALVEEVAACAKCLWKPWWMR